MVANESCKQCCHWKACVSISCTDSERSPLSLTILNYYAERVNNFKHSEHSIVLAIVLITKCSLKDGNKNDHRRIKRKKNTEKLWKLSKVIDREVEMCQNLLLQQFGG